MRCSHEHCLLSTPTPSNYTGRCCAATLQAPGPVKGSRQGGVRFLHLPPSVQLCPEPLRLAAMQCVGGCCCAFFMLGHPVKGIQPPNTSPYHTTCHAVPTVKTDTNAFRHGPQTDLGQLLSTVNIHDALIHLWLCQRLLGHTGVPAASQLGCEGVRVPQTVIHPKLPTALIKPQHRCLWPLHWTC